MSLLWPLQKALVARLKGDPGVSALVGQRVHDGQAPAGTGYPYVVVGESTEVEARTMGRSGFTDTVTVHIWSQYDGRKEALQVLTAIGRALAAPLVLDGYGSARLRQEFVTTLLDTDGPVTLRHVPARFRIFALEAAA